LNAADHANYSSSAFASGNLTGLQAILSARGIETWAALGSPGLAEFAAQGAIVAAFPYDPRPAQLPGADDPAGGPRLCLRVGAFASFHRYAALSRLLKSVARDLAASTSQPYQGFRVAVNSRLPEKQLAESSGLGRRGRSDLFLAHAYGPACILGILLLPFDPLEGRVSSKGVAGPADSNLADYCTRCRSCAEACPAQAIDGGLGGSFDDSFDGSPASPASGPGPSPAYRREACIQHWLSVRDDPPPALQPAFAGRLYGCDACILACPRSAGAWLADRADDSSPASRADALLLPAERRPGSFISASWLTTAGDEELKAFFRKTALGLSWFGPGMLKRNAALGMQRPGTAPGPGI